jgi:predicted MPP superfamily phosphohydrolase
MKTIIIGDVHGTTHWKDILDFENPNRVIFIGDYFDGYDNNVNEIQNFKNIIQYKNYNVCEVILLIGNHDHHYFPEIGYTGTSRYNLKKATKIEKLVNDNRSSLQIAYQLDNILFTHAGVSKTFMDSLFGEGKWDNRIVATELNNLFRFNPHAFEFDGVDSHGDDISQTPIWIRPRSLVADAIPNYLQVVGHTQFNNIKMHKNICFIDTMQHSREYLIYDGVSLSINSLK